MAKEYKMLNVRPHQHYLIGKLAGEQDMSVMDFLDEIIDVYANERGLVNAVKKWLRKFKQK